MQECSYLFITVSFAFCAGPRSCPRRVISLLPSLKVLILHRLQVPRDMASPIKSGLIYYCLLSGGCCQWTLAQFQIDLYLETEEQATVLLFQMLSFPL